MNIYIVYKIIRIANINSRDDNITVQNALFGAVSLTKNVDVDKYEYSGYGTAFDRTSRFSFPGGGYGQNVIIFGVDMNSSPHFNSWKRTKARIRWKFISSKKMYSINFSKNNKRFCLRLHYNGANSYLFVNGLEIIILKAKDSKIVASPLCLGNISKDWSVDNIRKSSFTGYVYDFSVGYDAIDVDDIKDII